MRDVDAVVVRRSTAEDVLALEAREPSTQGYARGAAERQSRGRVVFLVAELSGTLVGSAELTDGHPPEVKNLWVDRSAQGRGVGTALILAAERLVEERHDDESPGVRELVLGVAQDNPRAAALYERLGYVRTGVVAETTYEYVDERGVRRTATELDEDLLKRW